MCRISFYGELKLLFSSKVELRQKNHEKPDSGLQNPPLEDLPQLHPPLPSAMSSSFKWKSRVPPTIIPSDEKRSWNAGLGQIMALNVRTNRKNLAYEMSSSNFTIQASHVQYCPHIIAEVKLGMVKGIYSSFCPEDLHLFSRIKILDSRFWVYSSFSDSKLLPYYLSHPYPTAISELNWPLPLILNPYSFSAVHIHLSEILFSWFWKRNPKIWIFLYRGSTGIIFLFTYLYFTSS